MVPVEEPHNAQALENRTEGEPLHANNCTFGNEYPCFHGFVYAVDTAVPLVNFRQQTYWSPTGPYRWLMWGVILAGWLLVSAVAIGLTVLFRE